MAEGLEIEDKKRAGSPEDSDCGREHYRRIRTGDCVKAWPKRRRARDAGPCAGR